MKTKNEILFLLMLNVGNLYGMDKGETENKTSTRSSIEAELERASFSATALTTASTQATPPISMSMCFHWERAKGSIHQLVHNPTPAQKMSVGGCCIFSGAGLASGVTTTVGSTASSLPAFCGCAGLALFGIGVAVAGIWNFSSGLVDWTWERRFST